MRVLVELEVISPNDLTLEEVEKDLLFGEDQIGWNYYYKIISLEKKEDPNDQHN